MQIEVSFSVPPNRNLLKFRMSEHNLSASLELIMNALEAYKNSGQWTEDLDDPSIESDIFRRLHRTLSTKHAQEFKKILKDHHLSEADVCRKYGTDRIDELTGSDALDVIVKDILPTLKRKLNRSTNQ